MRIIFFFVVMLLPFWATAFQTSLAEDALIGTSDVTEARTGAYTEKLTLGDVFSEQFGKRNQGALPLDTKISFQVYVPPTYDPSHPPALLVYISPQKTAKPPKAWKDVINRQNLIWVGVNGSGNSAHLRKRLIDTLASVEYIAQRYKTDPKRQYLAGLSGGGRVSSIVAQTYPELFNGVIYIVGVNPLASPTPAKLEHMKKNRFVFLTGSSDFNRVETKKVYRQYKRVGIDRSKLIVVRGMGHRMPIARWFEESIMFLDSFLGADIATEAAPSDN